MTDPLQSLELGASSRQCESLGQNPTAVLHVISPVPSYLKMSSVISESSDHSEVKYQEHGQY